MSDEEDYMSDAFLAKCLPEDVRPGLKRVRIFSFFVNSGAERFLHND